MASNIRDPTPLRNYGRESRYSLENSYKPFVFNGCAPAIFMVRL